ncbi:hypothetical protein ACQ4PT_067175 [Festuca glaucescens]
MAARNTIPPRSGAPPVNPPLREPVPHRITPVRANGRGDEGTSNVVASNAYGRDAHGVQQSRPVQAANSFEQGSISSLGERNGERRDECFNGQGFGGFEEGYYEGNNGHGNGYGSMNRGLMAMVIDRYQRNFNNNENIVATTAAQVQNVDATQVVAATSGMSEANLSMQNTETTSVESLSARAQKKIDKMLCLRCSENGHLADACTAVLCLYCEKISHESNNCPLMSMPKPVATTYGVSRNELIFHEVSASSDVTFKHDSGKVGKISVTDVVLSPQEIVKELEWIIPGNHQWDLKPTEDGAFKVIFPSKADLARITKIINVPVPGTSMFLHFEEWSAADLDKFYLTKVWVRVHGCCYKERCDYMSLFGVGSLIGKAKEIDMEFTRAHSVVRMLVEVTRVEHILTTTVDHTYDGEGYGLLFKVECEKGKEKSDVIMQDVNPGDDSKDPEGKNKECPKRAEPPPMDGTTKSSSLV